MNRFEKHQDAKLKLRDLHVWQIYINGKFDCPMDGENCISEAELLHKMHFVKGDYLVLEVYPFAPENSRNVTAWVEETLSRPLSREELERDRGEAEMERNRA